ncbi:MAG: HlyD family efflux transporter periplasmic adaptor subunit [Holophagaceae bacterium]
MEPDSQMNSSLFRQEALEHLQQGEEATESLRVSPPWTWFLFFALGGVLLTTLIMTIIGKVEVQDAGRGIIRPIAGKRMLQAEIGGVLAETYARSGDSIKNGQIIARIDSAQIQGAILETDRQLNLQRSQGQSYAHRAEQLIQEQLDTVRIKIARQNTLVRSFEESVVFQRKKVDATRRLLSEKLVASINLDDAQDQLNVAMRTLDAAKQQLMELYQETSNLESRRQQNRWQRAQDLSGSQSKRDALDSSLRQSNVYAPVEGVLEALVAHPGDLIQPGQTIAKIIPEDSPLHVVAFLPEKDRAFVKSGDLVLIELDAYLFTEFGRLRGRVTRIGLDLASSYEIQEALGEGGKLDTPGYRVEIELLPDRPKGLSNVKIRPGMLLQARFTLRRQRLITIVLDPLKRWIE